MFSNFAEVALDSLMDDGFLKDVPIIGTFMGITRTVLAIQDRIFTKKVANFLNALSDIPIKDREEFVSSLEKEKSVRNVGEKILVLLDRLDNLDKATLIGEAFKYLVQKKISKQDFNMLCHSISMVYLGYLQKLVEQKRNPYMRTDNEVWLALVSCGLATMTVSGPETIDDLDVDKIGVEYKITAIGDVLVDILNARAQRA